MNIAQVELPIPAEYLPSGDHALIVAWATVGSVGSPISVLLCLEDGNPVLAQLDQIRFDYRFSSDRQKWVDVSGVRWSYDDLDGDEDVDADQESPGDGSEGVPGRVPAADGAGPSDPGDPGDEGAGRLDTSEGRSRR